MQRSRLRANPLSDGCSCTVESSSTAAAATVNEGGRRTDSKKDIQRKREEGIEREHELEGLLPR